MGEPQEQAEPLVAVPEVEVDKRLSMDQGIRDCIGGERLKGDIEAGDRGGRGWEEEDQDLSQGREQLVMEPQERSGRVPVSR